MSTAIQHWTPGDCEITEAAILALRSADELDAADVYDARLQHLERIHKTGFAELGLILCEVEDRRLWSKITDPDTQTYFTSFERWVVSRAPVCRSHAFNAMRAMRELRDVPIADLREMPQFAINTMRGLSGSVRCNPIIIEAAKTLSQREFGAKLANEFPGQHHEEESPLQLRPEKSARRLIDECFAAAMWCYDVGTREAALECIVAYFMDGRCEREECSELTNRQAYTATLGDEPCQS